MSEVAVSKVEGIIKTLSELEENIDSLNEKVADMKKKLHAKAENEIETLREKVVEIATKESESIISKTKDAANQDAKKILDDGEKSLAEIKAKINEKFDEAVEYTISSILK
jgi:V/A-type H+/Na+-transporting ATPase subunit G/H